MELSLVTQEILNIYINFYVWILFYIIQDSVIKTHEESQMQIGEEAGKLVGTEGCIGISLEWMEKGFREEKEADTAQKWELEKASETGTQIGEQGQNEIRNVSRVYIREGIVGHRGILVCPKDPEGPLEYFTNECSLIGFAFWKVTRVSCSEGIRKGQV